MVVLPRLATGGVVHLLLHIRYRQSAARGQVEGEARTVERDALDRAGCVGKIVQRFSALVSQMRAWNSARRVFK